MFKLPPRNYGGRKRRHTSRIKAPTRQPPTRRMLVSGRPYSGVDRVLGQAE
jgi:hypothetical protein